MFVFQACNTHADAPQKTYVAGTEGDKKYYSYFENAYGEQWVFTYDPDDQIAWLMGGDLGWNPKTIPPDSIKFTPEVPAPVVGNIVLNDPEALWVQACWAAVRGRYPKSR